MMPLLLASKDMALKLSSTVKHVYFVSIKFSRFELNREIKCT